VTLSRPDRCGGDTVVFPAGGDGATRSDAAAGEVSNQSITLDDTAGTRVGNDRLPPVQESPDGFLLRGDCTSLATCEIIVFVAEIGAGGCGASAAAAGFSVDGNLATHAAEAALRTDTIGCDGGAVVTKPPPPRPRPAALRRMRFRERPMPLQRRAGSRHVIERPR
jgi:hypothetical protein